eukprot:CAMPEP_0172202232 /NCGR_PEP_ID=MMETSP1050-20130122/30517_1 /TAXON_ID=233186 /ORGANISM="Cryptomonas curvata, Strain CCAP979/52" /LENGTH=101 /DNA_ID=CAMNT_0012880119 /DNA_START=9 /DNA_END=311 /DNA_ORIENTATION=-
MSAMLQKLLGSRQAVTVANDGREGLEAATRDGHAYDLILMDIQMPHMDGLESTRRIRQWEAETAAPERYFICAVTAHASDDDRKECLEAGMNRFVTKPVVP